MRRVLIAASALAVIVCHGRPAHAAQAVSGMLYVLSTGDNGRSTLRTVDVPSWRVTETVSLPRPRGRALALDPQGRPWVTHSGGPERDDDRVRVLAGSGAPSTTMRTCRRPDAGIAFAAGRAFVACAENGLGGSVDVFDVNTLAHVATISVAPPAGGAYYLTAVAASGARVVLAGMAKGPDPKRRYAAIATLDAEQPAVTWQSEPIADLDVWSIVPYGEDFLLANVASGASGETEHRADVLRLRPTNQLERITVAPFPALGGRRQRRAPSLPRPQLELGVVESDAHAVGLSPDETNGDAADLTGRLRCRQHRRVRGQDPPRVLGRRTRTRGLRVRHEGRAARRTDPGARRRQAGGRRIEGIAAMTRRLLRLRP